MRKLEALQTEYEVKPTKEFYKGTREFKMGFQARTSFCRDK